jgi:hypothetical protein
LLWEVIILKSHLTNFITTRNREPKMKFNMLYILILLSLLSFQNYSQVILEKKLETNNLAERFISISKETTLGSALDIIDKITREVESK